MSLSKARIIQRQIKGCLQDNELQRMRNESVLLQHPALFRHLPERTQKEHKKHSKEIRSQNQDSNPKSAEYKVTSHSIAMVSSLEMSWGGKNVTEHSKNQLTRLPLRCHVFNRPL